MDTGLIDIIIDAYKSKLNRKLVAKLYSSLQSFTKTSTLHIKCKWEKEAKITIFEEDWLNICKVQSNTSSSGLWREFVWKNLIRFFITPKIKQSQGGQPESGQCWRECGNCQADHFHIFWDCSIIQPYWSEITLMINQIIGLNIKQDFCILYLGNLSATVNVLARYLLKIMMAASKKTITRRWLTKEPPTKKDWIGIVSEIQNMEKFTFSLNLRMDKFVNYWNKWTNHLNTSTS